MSLATFGGVQEKLGEILMRYYRVSPASIDAALATQRYVGRGRLGDMLLRQRAVTEENLVRALAWQHKLPALIGIAGMEIPKEILELIPAGIAAWERLLPVARTTAPDGTRYLIVASTRPRDAALVEELETLVRCRVGIALTTEDDLAVALRRFYGSGATTRPESESASRDAATEAELQIGDVGDLDLTEATATGAF